ncbi:excinuclease ABC subunit UvrB [Candidatus Nomurabacteria bacterium]|nr:excinuclease ABC subunit UvrB [Candidatus Nomurabacteria bacterium]
MKSDQPFQLKSDYTPAGDQPKAIEQLVEGLRRGDEKQTLLGVTGSGKTFTIANVIQEIQKPTLVIAHNKTLAAQLAQEFQEFFPDAAVHYFVSYYDYYQPEAYLAASDTYIEKEAQINDEIDRLRHATTQSLLTRDDVIIVASVSCIYGLGSPEEYKKKHLVLAAGESVIKRDLFKDLSRMQYERTTADLKPGTYRSTGNVIDIMPASREVIFQIQMMGSRVVNILELDPISMTITQEHEAVFIFPAKHFMTPEDQRLRAIDLIEKELAAQIKKFEKEGKLLELERIKRRTRYDLALLREIGYCRGIENYSRHMSGKAEGEAPDTLLSYFPHDANGKPDFLTVIDESHVTTPQIGGMYAADRSRKENLVEFGFRLPSAKDNRPLQMNEFWDRVGQTIFVSATPSDANKEMSSQIVEQIIRPTGLVDPEIDVRPVTPTSTVIPAKAGISLGQATQYPGQIQDFINDAVAEIEKGGRVLATTLTKKMAEDLAEYLTERKIKAEYLHSDVETLDRIKILTSLRKGEFDCLIGVNLLREGLDLPEVTLVAILDADKSGFLRSETSLVQTIGRAARNVGGRVTLYADTITPAMQYAIDETARRREIQLAYNKKHNITPQTVKKKIKDITEQLESSHAKTVHQQLKIDLAAYGGDVKKVIKRKREQMEDAVERLDFESAAIIRDEIILLEKKEQGD